MGECMSQEEFDSRLSAGEDVYGIVADDYRRRGWWFRDGRWQPPDVLGAADAVREPVVPNAEGLRAAIAQAIMEADQRERGWGDYLREADAVLLLLVGERARWQADATRRIEALEPPQGIPGLPNAGPEFDHGYTFAIADVLAVLRDAGQEGTA